MIIQNTNQTNLAAQPDMRVSDNAPKAVADTSIQDTSQQPSSQQLKTAVNGINQVMQKSNQNLEFSVDPNSKKPIVQMVDAATGELILQIPSKVALAIAQSIDQYQHGLLLNQKA